MAKVMRHAICYTVLFLSLNAQALTNHGKLPNRFTDIARREALPWHGAVVRVADAVAGVHATPNSALFRIQEDGVATLLAGLQSNWHFDCFLHELVPRAVKHFPSSAFPMYLLLHGWDEALVRINEPQCESRWGSLHGNIWNKHIPNPPRLPWFSNGKIVGCHADMVVPHEQYCEQVQRGRRPVSEVPWDQRLAVGFFRGTSTGFGMNGRESNAQSGPENHRQRLVREMRGHRIHFNAGVTDQPPGGGVGAPAVPLQDWAQWKYHVDPGGNTYSPRMADIARINSTLIAVSAYDDAFTLSLSEGTHYLRAAFDGSDLFLKKLWLDNHPNEARQLGEALTRHYDSTWDADGQTQYVVALLRAYMEAVTWVA